MILYISLGEGTWSKVSTASFWRIFLKNPGGTKNGEQRDNKTYVILYISLGVCNNCQRPPSWSVFLKIPGRANGLYVILYSRGRFQEYATPLLGPFS